MTLAQNINIHYLKYNIKATIYINKIEDVRMSEIDGRPNCSADLAEILNGASLCTPERRDDSFIPPTLTPGVRGAQDHKS